MKGWRVFGDLHITISALELGRSSIYLGKPTSFFVGYYLRFSFLRQISDVRSLFVAIIRQKQGILTPEVCPIELFEFPNAIPMAVRSAGSGEPCLVSSTLILSSRLHVDRNYSND
jgi:hypothetical protein